MATNNGFTRADVARDLIRAYHRAWSARNKERIKAYRAAYIAKAGDKVTAGIERWRKANQARVNKKGAEWRAAHPEAAKRIIKRYQKAHPDQVKANVARRRAARRSAKCECCAPADFRPVYDMAFLLAWEVDHIKPLALGGEHCVKNLQVLSVEAHKEKTRADRKAIRAAHANLTR
jgi:5-methylcytosine-specific restriction endonuclease McrA